MMEPEISTKHNIKQIRTKIDQEIRTKIDQKISYEQIRNISDLQIKVLNMR